MRRIGNRPSIVTSIASDSAFEEPRRSKEEECEPSEAVVDCADGRAEGNDEG